VDFKAKNEDRYSWLQNVCDADGNPEGVISLLYFECYSFEAKIVFILLLP
jgi:hypothetical protein